MRFPHPVFTVIAYFLVMTFGSVTSRTHRTRNEQESHNSNNQMHTQHSHQNEIQPWRKTENVEKKVGESSVPSHHSNHIRRESNYKSHPRGHRSSEEEYSEENDYERHAYIMTTDHIKPSPVDDEHATLQEAFQKHMNPNFKAPHDIYAYKLPSDLWFIVRYKTNASGLQDKYMNIVSSFTKYLDKMDSSTKSVSVNVNGVETVFRLTSKS